MKYRVEKKFICTEAELQILESRISVLMRPDIHQTGTSYLIRSLYFDTWDNACMNENDAGIDNREKYRIRTYNNNLEMLRLEIKEKSRGYCHKRQCRIDLAQLSKFCSDELPQMTPETSPVLNRFWLMKAMYLLHPVAIIQYERTAYVYPAGNVRITFDRNISASDQTDDFTESNPTMHPVLPTGKHLLEVKYDEFLPDAIAQVLELGNLQQTTFSKYYIGRLALGR